MITKKEAIPLEKLEVIAGSKIFNRGKRYYKQGKIKNFEIDGDIVKAKVAGSSSRAYNVSLYFEDGELNGISCSCPYDWGPVCKHIVAVALKYNDEIVRHKTIKNQRISWRDMIKEEETDKIDNVSEKFLFYLNIYTDIWEIEAVKKYIKKDGTYGRDLEINTWDLKQNNSKYKLLSSEILALKYIDSVKHDYRRLKTGFKYGSDFGEILNLLRASKIYINGLLDHPLKYNYDFHLIYRIEKKGSDYLFFMELSDGRGKIIAIDDKFLLLTVKPIHLLSADKIIYQIKRNVEARYILPFTNKKRPLKIKKSEIKEFIQKVYPEIIAGGIKFDLPDELKIIEIKGLSGKALYLNEENGELLIKPLFYYGENKTEVDARPFRKKMIIESEKASYLIHRQAEVEKSWLKFLEKYRLQYHLNGDYKLKYKTNPIDWMFETLPIFTENGFAIYGEENLKKLKVHHGKAKIISSVSSGIDWFDLNVKIDFDGIQVSYSEVLKALKKNKKYIQLSDGPYVMLNNEIVEKLGFIASFSEKDKKSGNLKFSENQALILNEILSAADHTKTDTNFKKKLKKIKSFEKIESVVPAKEFKGKLRSYQKAGLDWLTFLRDYGFGGCLADDMGLGKTIQALALLQNEKNAGKEKSLIIAPTSVISNWLVEAEKFTPQLKVLLHYGPDRRKNNEEFDNYDLIVTSYALILRDFKIFNGIRFNYVILDESQKIKNPFSLTAKAVGNLHAQHRLVMTGTPIENNLTELWSQFHFVNPGMLGNIKSFQSNFARLIEKEGDMQKAQQLKRIINPFVLRRTKEEVLKELPPKVENIMYCEMDASHRKEYNKWRDYYRMEILGVIEKNGIAKSKIKILEGLTKLRQVSIHPKMVNAKYNKSSGKMDALLDLIEDIKNEGHKALIFSQFVKALSLLRAQLDQETVDYCYLDGGSKNRQKIVDRFQTDSDVKLFLISLKAGGLGLNLTAADYVIHIDPWWNPAVENQATDRSHRIGQKKKVFVYKLITKGTVEEKVLKLQEKKKALAEELISSEAAIIKNISREDIENLFS